jgi:hypothetical protein
VKVPNEKEQENKDNTLKEIKKKMNLIVIKQD